MIAKDICWDIRMAEIWEILNSKSDTMAAADLELPIETYANMDRDERYDYAEKYFRSQRRINDFMRLPNEVDLPNNIDKEDIPDWLRDNYEHCAIEFNLIPEKSDLKNFVKDLKDLMAEYEEKGISQKYLTQALTKILSNGEGKSVER